MIKRTDQGLAKWQHLNSHQLWSEFISKTLLVNDWKRFWIFEWPETRWNATHVAEKLSELGLADITKRSVKNGEAMEVWLKADVVPKVIEEALLGKRREKIAYNVKRGWT